MPYFSAREIIASTRAKYASFGVDKSCGVVNGAMPSNVVPSALHAVYWTQRRLIQSVLIPAAFRDTMNFSASLTEMFPIRD